MKWTVLILSALAALGTAAKADPFMLRVENLGPQPLSPVFYSAGNLNFNVFSIGDGASGGIKQIAETGGTADMFAIATAAGSHVAAFGATSGGPIMPGQIRSLTFDTDAAHPYFSFASMLGMTNDGFIGESVNTLALNLYSGGTPTGFGITIFGDRAWDSGTEKNTQDAADLAALGGSGNPAEDTGFNVVRVHGGIVAGVGDSWHLLPNWNSGTALARIDVTPVPEPVGMFALGLGAVAIWSRRRKRDR